ncbi:MAG: type VI secretion system baseplate subunit TssG [Alteromonadaceae bacterium]|uniref:type VI secretion system baseplate subunit TssG n=1 Tax=unclassified Marinobacter TaxID=83889 RepID=UPI000C4AD1AB|nr:type VI secretion system baseplate subunit TssG [Marinobacter sp. BGYM27]MAA65954.1 type VI secretion system baseplate subunit TssG [Alteromonadaceae bacterium]MBH86491.1 type VI secretion system baseplate subunit TssG [Alteromonadaceae bacterium]MDG5501109.1 type VI secretion system baseplate subunit TssG [Marinobacter sp. BGYM27]|tara:strand:+ start:15662 stop:16678 length:1017 start_codon:yes stop_codon:yes gene_type:complete
MDVADRAAAPDVVGLQPVLGDARRYSFFQLVDLIHRLHGDDLERSTDEAPQNERIRFSSTASLGFPGSDVLSAVLPEHEYAPYQMEVSFLGLHGSQSPLPGYYLEDLAWEQGQNTGIRRYFLDFFNHRLVTLFHRVWRKYRYYVRFQPGATDAFSEHIFSLVGLGDRDLRGDTPINWSKMMAYAGLMAGRSRSPEVVSGIVAHCFDLADVEIEPWVLRKVDIPEDQQTRLGGNNARLGEDTLIGSRIRDRSGKFILRLKELTRERFADFLPNGRDHSKLVKLVEFTMREQLAYDLELVIRPEDVFPIQLGADVRLGWNSFVNPVAGEPQQPVRIQIRR